MHARKVSSVLAVLLGLLWTAPDALGAECPPCSAVLQNDGRIVAYGHEYVTGDFVMRRFYQDGAVDRTYGRRGTVRKSFGFVGPAVLAPGNKVVVAGTRFAGDVFLARFTRHGSLDPTFGRNGRAAISLPAPVTQMMDLTVDRYGRPIVLMSTPEGTPFIGRVRRDGRLDQSLGGDGAVEAGPNTDLGAVVAQRDLKIVVAAGQEFRVARFNPDGSADQTFGGGDGVATATTTESISRATEVVVQPDGRILAGGFGSHERSAPVTVVLVRYLSSGAQDPTFGCGDGVVSGDDQGDVSSIAFDRGSRIVVATPNQDQWTVLRYRPDGSLDPSFDEDGVVVSQLGGFGHVVSVGLQPSGRIIAAGWVFATFRNRLALVGYRSNGSFAPGFGGGDGWVFDPEIRPSP